MDKFGSYLEARVRVLEHIVEGDDVSKILDILCRDTEAIDPSMRCSVLYFNKNTKCLGHAAAPSLPDFYNDAIDGLEIGVGVGSCGTAAFTGERVIVDNVYTHPYWAPYRDLAKEVGFHACWSQPIYSKEKDVLGTFAMYFDEVREPSAEEIHLIQASASLASLVIARSQAEAELIVSEQKLRDFAEVSSDWFWEMDEALRFTGFSGHFTEIFGLDKNTYIGKTRRELAVGRLDDEHWQKHLKDLDEHRAFDNFAYYIEVPERDPLYISISGRPVFDGDGSFAGYRGTGTDVTERKRADEALQTAKNAAETASRAKSEFLASMSHELRTPLNAVLGFAQMLQFDPRSKLSSSQNESVESILSGGNHLLELVDEILDLAKIEANQISLSLEDISANEIIDDCVGLINPIADLRGIKIVNEFRKQSPEHLRTDRQRLRQILLNLLTNAVNYNKDGGTITISAEKTEDSFLRISIADTGIGIAVIDQASVFQMFHRVGANPMMTREGTGIGLTVTKLLVDRMAGRIGFESEEGVGSTFWIELPLVTNDEVIIWSDTLRVGVDAIDKDHQMIISLVNRITHRSVDDVELDTIVNDMIDYTRYHFRREEAIMQVCGYPDLEVHRQLHHKLVAETIELADAWRKDRNLMTLKNLRKFLRDWWMGHISNVDTVIAKYTKGKELIIRNHLERLG